MNVPVLAVKSTETEVLKKYLILYEKNMDICQLLRGEIKRPFSSNEERVAFIENNSWDNRIQQIEEILNTMEEWKR